MSEELTIEVLVFSARMKEKLLFTLRVSEPTSQLSNQPPSDFRVMDSGNHWSHSLPTSRWTALGIAAQNVLGYLRVIVQVAWDRTKNFPPGCCNPSKCILLSGLDLPRRSASRAEELMLLHMHTEHEDSHVGMQKNPNCTHRARASKLKQSKLDVHS